MRWQIWCENQHTEGDGGKMEERTCVPDHIFEHLNQPQEQLSLDFMFNNAVNVPKVQASIVNVFQVLRQSILQNSEPHKCFGSRKS